MSRLTKTKPSQFAADRLSEKQASSKSGTVAVGTCLRSPAGPSQRERAAIPLGRCGSERSRFPRCWHTLWKAALPVVAAEHQHGLSRPDTPRNFPVWSPLPDRPLPNPLPDLILFEPPEFLGDVALRWHSATDCVDAKRTQANRGLVVVTAAP